MKFLFLIFLALVNTCWATYVAVLETVTDSKDLLTLSERQYLTNVLREQAVKILPAEQNYTIMTRENINAMLPPGKAIEDCEGSCLAETGRNIAADYVAQARVGKVGTTLFISAEVYETSGNKLVASYNGRGESIDNLENVINEKSPEFFRKIRGGNSFTGVAALSSAGGFSVSGSRSYVISVNTVPAGAALSIDGRPVPKCTVTPCKIQVEAGEHRFVTVLDLYEDSDTLVNVSANNQNVEIHLNAGFGSLYLAPSMVEHAGRSSDLVMLVDNKRVKAGSINLAPGVHDVQISHPCYDPMHFKVGIEKGKTERIEKPLNLAKGGISLNAEANGEPQVVPVFIDGNNVGSTPYLGEVGICSKIEIGEQRELVRTALKYHETVDVTHRLRNSTPVTVKQDLWDSGYETLDQELGKQPKRSVYSSGSSVPSNVSQGRQIHWVPIGISAAIIALGTTLAIVENAAAKNYYNEGATNQEEFNDKKDKISNAQTVRTVGIGLAVAGAIGLGLSIAF